MVVFAAPPAEVPSNMTVPQDGKTHSVYVFGMALALVSTDESINVSSIGPVGRVDVMVDGVVTKNVASIDIPAGQKTKMALEEGSIIVKNVTTESGDVVKKQIEDAYATGAESIDLASLTNVTAYKVNEDGNIENAEGKAVSNNTVGISVSSVEATTESFGEVMKEIIAEDNASEAATAIAKSNSSSSSSSSSSSNSSSSSSVSGNSIN